LLTAFQGHVKCRPSRGKGGFFGEEREQNEARYVTVAIAEKRKPLEVIRRIEINSRMTKKKQAKRKATKGDSIRNHVD
jgi:hypothetical protein